MKRPRFNLTRTSRVLAVCKCAVVAVGLVSCRGTFDLSGTDPTGLCAIPVIAVDPYVSCWSTTANLYDSPLCNNDGDRINFTGVLKVDSVSYRFLGDNRKILIPVAGKQKDGSWRAKYTITEPELDWTLPEYDDTEWDSGYAAFGEQYIMNINTTVPVDEGLWIRRIIDLGGVADPGTLFLRSSGAEGVSFFLDGRELPAAVCQEDNDYLYELSSVFAEAATVGSVVVAAYFPPSSFREHPVDFGIYRISTESESFPLSAVQKQVSLTATRTVYEFECGGVDLTLTFMAPFIADRPATLERPLNYISYEVCSRDGMPHDISLYLEVEPDWATGSVYRRTEGGWFERFGLLFFRCGVLNQEFLSAREGERSRNWGFFYFSAEDDECSQMSAGKVSLLREQYRQYGEFRERQDSDRTEDENLNVSLGVIRTHKNERRSRGLFCIGYDDVYSIRYFGDNLKPNYTKEKKSIEEIFKEAHKQYRKTVGLCAEFDSRFGSEPWVHRDNMLPASAYYRPLMASHKFVTSTEGVPLLMSCDMGSGIMAGTAVRNVSVPLLTALDPHLAEACLESIYRFASSDGWSRPYAPDNIGTYPVAAREVGTSESRMRITGETLDQTLWMTAQTGDPAFVEKHWSVISVWLKYLYVNIKAGSSAEETGFYRSILTDWIAMAENTGLPLPFTGEDIAAAARIQRSGFRNDTSLIPPFSRLDIDAAPFYFNPQKAL